MKVLMVKYLKYINNNRSPAPLPHESFRVAQRESPLPHESFRVSQRKSTNRNKFNQ